MSNYSKGNLEAIQSQAQNTSWSKIFNYVETGSKVLDVGCSSGNLGKELKIQKQCQVFGIEIDDSDFEAAKKALDGVYNVNIETQKLPAALAKQRFDSIILADVIEHFVRPAEALSVLKTLLAPGGRIIFSIPNMAHISVRLQLLAGRLIYGETGLLDKTHLHFYDYDEVERVMRGAGLQIKTIDANMLPYPPSFVRSKLSKLGLQDKQFTEKLKNDTNANAFQFVGFAVPSRSIKPVPLATTTPEHELIEYIESQNDLNERHHKLAAEHKQLIEQITELERQLIDARRRLHRINNSLPFRIAKKIVKPIRQRRQKSGR